MSTTSTIIYTLTDEAPALATRSLLPIVQAFTERRRRSARNARHLARGPHPRAVPRSPHPGAAADRDDLADLGELATTPDANIIKLPNISASMPQLKAAIKELQCQGYALPDYPDDPKRTSRERRPARATTRSWAARSTRCCAKATPIAARRLSVKNYARKHPHKMGAWTADSQDARRAHGRRRLLRQREVRADRAARQSQDRVHGRRRHEDRAERKDRRCSRARSSTPP